MKIFSVAQIEILTLLSKYGVMGSSTILKLLNNKTNSRRLREILTALEKRGLLARANVGLGGSPTSYWMLVDSESKNGKALSDAGLDPCFFRNKKTRYTHMPHESLCTLFQASIERQMPTVRIYRESTNNFSELPDHLISESVKDNGYTPDLCLGIPVVGSSGDSKLDTFRWVAVEIDRTQRSKKRISKRVNLYTRHTAFAGLLYLVPDKNALLQLGKIYSTRGASDSQRITGTRKTFLASAVAATDLIDVNQMSVWCGDYELPLSFWLSLFAAGESQSRDERLSQLFTPVPKSENFMRAN